MPFNFHKLFCATGALKRGGYIAFMRVTQDMILIYETDIAFDKFSHELSLHNIEE